MFDSANGLNVRFIGGYVVDRNTTVIAAGWADDPDENSSVILFRFGDQWASYTVDNDTITSLAMVNGQCFAMGGNGLVKIFGRPGQAFTFDTVRGDIGQIHIGEKRAPLERIHVAGDDVFVCGWKGQLYRLADGRFGRFDRGVDDPEKTHFLHMCGGVSALYAAGMKGRLYRSDGKKWQKLPRPTNAHINCAMQVAEEIYLGAADGSLYRGNENGWSFIGNEDLEDDIWSLAHFEGVVYAAASKSLYRVDGHDLTPVATGINTRSFFNGLHAGDGRLWSFGETELLGFDGTRWKVVPCPANGMV